MNVLITGATGFIGHHLCHRLTYEGLAVRCAVRNPGQIIGASVVGDISPGTSWKEALAGIDTVVHLAALTNTGPGKSAEAIAEFRKVNTEGTLALARQAAESGIKRFVFMSSIHVNGNQTNRPFTELDAPNPIGPYAVSKLEAEIGLQMLSSQADMKTVVIRSPIVYGYNAPGNFGRLVHWIKKGIPLPLGDIRNQRSLVGLDNLVDFIVTCMAHPAAANQTFLVADGEDLSTTDLLHRIARAYGNPVHLIPVPEALLKLGLIFLGKKGMANRLCGSLQLDISKARKLLNWSPPISVDEGFRRMAGKLAE